MIKSVLFSFSMILTSVTFGQGDTIVIVKEGLEIFACKTASAQNWYLFSYDNYNFTLCELNMPSKDVEAWYQRFGGSQNLYRGRVRQELAGEVIEFNRNNSPEDRIYFEVVDRSKKHLELYIKAFGEHYLFERLE